MKVVSLTFDSYFNTQFSKRMKDKKNNLRSSVMSYYNYLRTKLDDASEAMRKAWQLAKLKAHLQEGGSAVVRYFKSKDDIPQLRHAVSLEGRYESKGTGRKSPMQFTYFDELKAAVRSFNITRFESCAMA